MEKRWNDSKTHTDGKKNKKTQFTAIGGKDCADADGVAGTQDAQTGSSC